MWKTMSHLINAWLQWGKSQISSHSLKRSSPLFASFCVPSSALISLLPTFSWFVFSLNLSSSTSYTVEPKKVNLKLAFFNYWSHCVCRTRVRPLPIPWLHNGVTPASKGSRLGHPTWCRSELGQWLVMAATAARPILAPTYRVGTSLNFEFWKVVDVSNQTKQPSLFGITGCSSLYWFQIHGIILNVCSFNHFLSLILKADPPKSWQEQFPLIVGSITASLVFIIAVVVIAIVCLRSEYNPSSQTWSMWQAKSVQVENAEKNAVRDFKCQLWLHVLCGTLQHCQWIALPPVRPLNSRLAFGICE